MDPLSVQASQNLPQLRLPLALGADLSAVLREGRIVAGQVLQTLDGSTILIGLGSHRVPAEAHVELAPGERFVAKVVAGEGGRVELAILRPGGEGQSPLLAALRGVLGDGRPVGEVLHELAALLRAAAGEEGAPRSALLAAAEAAEASVWTPAAGAAELRALVVQAGQTYEAALLAWAGRGRGLRSGDELASELVERVLRELLALARGSREALPVSRLSRLARSLGEALAREFDALPRNAPQIADGSLERLADEIAGRLPGASDTARRLANSLGGERGRAALERVLAGRGGERERAIAALTAILAEALDGVSQDALARALRAGLQLSWSDLASGGLDAEAFRDRLLGPLSRTFAALVEAGVLPEGAQAQLGEALRRALSGPRGRELARALAEAIGVRVDGLEPAPPRPLVARLLALLSDLPEGKLRARVRGALGALDAEALTDLARRELGEGRSIALPFPDGPRWSTLHLRLAEQHGSEDREGGEDLVRLRIDVELSRLGPLRVHLGWRRGRLVARFEVESEQSRARLAAGLEALRERLGSGGDGVSLGIDVVPRERLSGDPLVDGVGLLREHRLMDLEG